LRHHLEIISSDTWQRLKDSGRYGIKQGEETLTDNLLLYLMRNNLKNVYIRQTSKHKESIQGTDWEWWVGNSKIGWLRYAVQAKKLDYKTGRYASLKHHVGLRSNQQFQHDILKMYSLKNNAIPLYVFYNYIDKSNYSPYWQCQQPINIPMLGCTITPLKNIINALGTHGARSFDEMHKLKETIPLSCLVDCPTIGKIYQGNNNTAQQRFGVEAVVYKDSQLKSLYSCENKTPLFPSELYDHDFQHYPKRTLIIEVDLD